MKFLSEMTLDELHAEAAYWQTRIKGKTSWGADLAAAKEFLDDCNREIRRRENKQMTSIDDAAQRAAALLAEPMIKAIKNHRKDAYLAGWRAGREAAAKVARSYPLGNPFTDGHVAAGLIRHGQDAAARDIAEAISDLPEPSQEDER